MKLLAALTLLGTLAQSDSRVAIVRVHGNHTVPDAEVLQIAGVARGDAFETDTASEIKERLLRSGKFATAEVRVRYRGLSESSDVALILLVREKRSTASRFMVGPLVDISNEYGLTLGARLAFVDFATKGGRIAFPLSWGGKRQAGVETTFPVGEGQQLRFDLSRWRQVNPHFDIPDNRLEVGGRFVKSVRRASFHVRGQWSEVDFELPEQRFASLGAKAVLDTRVDPTVPGDAVYLGVDWRRLFFLAGVERSDVNQYTVDLRGYKRLIGQSLLAGQFYWAIADGPMPPYEQPFVGGGKTLRGYKAGRFIGDNAATGTVELRIPLTSPTSFARAGIHFFYDTGTAYDYGVSLSEARFHHALGVGAFFKVLIGLRIDMGWDLEGGSRFSIESQMKF